MFEAISTQAQVVINKYYLKALNLKAKPNLLGKISRIEKDDNRVVYQK
jgi:hypothetical protein